MNRLLIIAILFYSVYSYAQNVSAREAINVSGQQRMLVFKTGKCHLAILRNIDQSEHQEELNFGIVDQIEAYALTSERYNELITKLEETATSDNVAHVINISGRQRMLSQRIALYFMMCAEDMGGSIAKVRLNTSLEKYALSLNELKNSQLNNDDIATQLKTIEDEWSQTNKTCESVSSNTKDEIINLLEQSEKMLVVMEKVTSMYEQKMETMLRSN